MKGFLYNCYIYFLGAGISIASIFNPKARQWRTDRKNQSLSSFESKVSWFHVSSLGELEQAYPLIEELKQKNYFTVVSFFSNSGYSQSAKYKSIDYPFLLPLDTYKNARRTVAEIKPSIVFWTKNDFWLNVMNEIRNENIPLILFSSIFYPNHLITKSWASPFRSTLNSLNHIFVQDPKSLELLQELNIDKVSVSGDTRITRVKKRALSKNNIKGMKEFCNGQPLLILASVHSEDRQIIEQSLKVVNEFKIIIVPHDIDQNNIESILRSIDPKKYTISTDFINIDTDVLVFNKMGHLFDLYQYSDIIYIGGGFGSGIHNILEPTVYGNSVIFGPKFEKFWEARTFLEQSVAYSCSSAEEYFRIIESLTKAERNRIKNDLAHFYDNYQDSVKYILDYCESENLIS